MGFNSFEACFQNPGGFPSATWPKHLLVKPSACAWPRTLLTNKPFEGQECPRFIPRNVHISIISFPFLFDCFGPGLLILTDSGQLVLALQTHRHSAAWFRADGGRWRLTLSALCGCASFIDDSKGQQADYPYADLDIVDELMLMLVCWYVDKLTHIKDSWISEYWITRRANHCQPSKEVCGFQSNSSSFKTFVQAHVCLKKLPVWEQHRPHGHFKKTELHLGMDEIARKIGCFPLSLTCQTPHNDLLQNHDSKDYQLKHIWNILTPIQYPSTRKFPDFLWENLMVLSVKHVVVAWGPLRMTAQQFHHQARLGLGAIAKHRLQMKHFFDAEMIDVLQNVADVLANNPICIQVIGTSRRFVYEKLKGVRSLEHTFWRPRSDLDLQ